MAYTLLAVFTLFFSVQYTHAQGIVEAKGSFQCIGSQVWGSKGEFDECQNAASRMNLLSTDSMKVTSVCRDVRNNLQARLDSGCLVSAFVIETSVGIDVAKADREARTVTNLCERSGDDGDVWKNNCLNGTDPLAKEAKDCAVQAVIGSCKNKGLGKCTAANASISFEYYYWGEPRCIAKAQIVN